MVGSLPSQVRAGDLNQDQARWEQFKSEYGRNYTDPDEEETRKDLTHLTCEPSTCG